MQNYIKTILSAFKTWTQKKIKDSTADWNQNDSNADSFVKGRTHWEEKWTKVLVDNLTSKEYEAGNFSKCNFIPGNKYTVIWNDITYTDLVCWHDGDYNIIADDENKYPFYIDDDGGNGLYIETEDVPYTVSIIEDDIKVHKLDKKYLDLPPNLATTDDVQEALDVANTAQTTADNKMDAINPVGTGSFSMNRKANTTVGDYSHAEGYSTTASGDFSHAEGCGTTASGMYSHAEGYQNRATGQGAHVEGEATAYGVYKYNLASGRASHAEGSYTTASGDFSHAEGSGTIAAGVTQHVQGSNNISDSDGIYTHIVGNGTSDTKRSNAHTLDWEGNAWYSGDVYVGSTSGTNRDEGSKKLATVEEVQELASQISSQPYVVQAEEPEDKKLFWVDLDDDTEDPELNEAIEAAISEAKAASIPVPNVAEVGQTIVVKEVDENNKPTAWEAVELPKSEVWEDVCDITTEEEASVIYHNFGAKYKKIKVTFEYDFGENVSTGIYVHENTDKAPGNLGYSASWMVPYGHLNQGVALFTSFAKESRFLGTGEKHYVNVGINTTSKISSVIASAIYQPICRLSQMPNIILNSDEYIEKGIFSLRIAATNATAIFPAGTRLYVKGVRA